MSGAADRSRLRAAGLAVLGFVAVVALLVGSTTAWSIRTAQDSEWVEARVESLLQREEVSDALARRVVEEVATSLQLEQQVADSLPDALDPAVGFLFAGARTWIEGQLAELIRSEAVASGVAAAIGRAHGVAVDVIQGDDVVDGIAIENGEVRVNLLPVVADSLRLVQRVGLLRDAEIPELDRFGDPDEQRAQLELALGRTLAEDFGQPVLIRSEALDELGTTVSLVQDLLVFGRRVVLLILAIGLALAGLTIWWSRQRWRTAGLLLGGFFVGVLVIRRVLRRVGDELPDAVESPGARTTVAELVGSLERSLTGTLFTVAFAGLVALAAAAYLVARTPRLAGAGGDHDAEAASDTSGATHTGADDESGPPVSAR